MDETEAAATKIQSFFRGCKGDIELKSLEKLDAPKSLNMSTNGMHNYSNFPKEALQSEFKSGGKL